METRLFLDDRGCDAAKAEVDAKTKADRAATDDDDPGIRALLCSGQLALLQLPPYSSRAVFE